MCGQRSEGSALVIVCEQTCVPVCMFVCIGLIGQHMVRGAGKSRILHVYERVCAGQKPHVNTMP